MKMPRNVTLKIYFPPIFLRQLIAYIKHAHSIDNYFIWRIESMIYGGLEPMGKLMEGSKGYSGGYQNADCRRCHKTFSAGYYELLDKARKEFCEYLPA